MITSLQELGFANRLDMTGIRDKGVDRPEYEREDEFPYDMPLLYGQPTDYDRGGSTAVDPSFNGITPRDTEHSAWDEVDEVLGMPVLLSKGAGGGQSGGTVPGSGGSWSSGQGPWDAEEVDDAELDEFGENIVKRQEDEFFDPEDSPDVMDFPSPYQFSSGLGRSLGPNRPTRGLISKESAWSVFVKK